MTNAQTQTIATLRKGYRNARAHYNGGAALVIADTLPVPHVFLVAPNGTYVQVQDATNAAHWIEDADSGRIPLV